MYRGHTVFTSFVHFNDVLYIQVSRAQILKKAAEYIQFIRRKNQSHQSDIDDLKKQNSTLEQQSKSICLTCYHRIPVPQEVGLS